MGVLMNARSMDILHMLLENEGYISVNKIAETMKVSKRSVYYDIYHINDWLAYYNLPELEIVRKKGICLSRSEKSKIEEVLRESCVDDEYIFSPTERANIIICSVIYSETPIYIEQLMEYCNVSRNTIFNDLNMVESELKNFELKLFYEPKKGYRIEGDVVKVRAAYIAYFSRLQPLYEIGQLPFLSEETVGKYISILREIESRLHVNYVEGVVITLAALLPIIVRGNSGLTIPNLKREEVESTREFTLVEEYFPEIEWVEKIYLCIHLLGSRVTVNSSDIFHERPNKRVYDVTKTLVAEFEKVACVTFRDRDELEQALFAHVGASLYRYQYGIQIGDSIGEDVIREYPELFEITKRASRYLEQMIGMPVPDKEIAFLALHFGAHLTLPMTNGNRLRILVVCVNGVSTGYMIRREVQKLLPEAEVVGVESLRSIHNAQEICDVIISTVKMKNVVPVITIHPVMTDRDREHILEHPRVKSFVARFNLEHLLDEIHPYIRPEDWDEVKTKVTNCLVQENVVTQTYTKKKKLGFVDLLKNDRIRMTDGVETWTQSLWMAGEKLIQEKSIEDRYINNIVSQLQYYGPYMFITPRVILAHAKPEDGVRSLDASMMISKKEIVFSDFHKANIVIVLAAVDQEKHLRILKEIAEIFSIQTRIDDLIQMENQEEVLMYLENLIEEKNE